MEKISYCICGSPMSNYETQNYEKCTTCYLREQSILLEEAAERKKREVAEKERSVQEEREQKILEQRKQLTNVLKQLKGKTIESVILKSWTDILGTQELMEIEIVFRDGSTASFSKEECADGCRGDYDYYHYLDANVRISKSENEDQ